MTQTQSLMLQVDQFKFLSGKRRTRPRILPLHPGLLPRGEGKVGPLSGRATAIFTNPATVFLNKRRTWLPFPKGRDEHSPKDSRFEPLNHAALSSVSTLRAFLPLRVGGVGGADGERAGVRCMFQHLRVHGTGKARVTNPAIGILRHRWLSCCLLAFLFAGARLLPGQVPPGKFQNPLNPGPDPYMEFFDGNYYLTTTQGDAIRMWQAPRSPG